MRAFLRFAVVTAAVVHAIPGDTTATKTQGAADGRLREFVTNLRDDPTVNGIKTALSIVIKDLKDDAAHVLNSNLEAINKAFSYDEKRNIYGTVETVSSQAYEWRKTWTHEKEVNQNIARSFYTAIEVTAALAERLNSYLDEALRKANAKPEQPFISDEGLKQLRDEGLKFAAQAPGSKPYMEKKLTAFKTAIGAGETPAADVSKTSLELGGPSPVSKVVEEFVTTVNSDSSILDAVLKGTIKLFESLPKAVEEHVSHHCGSGGKCSEEPDKIVQSANGMVERERKSLEEKLLALVADKVGTMFKFVEMNLSKKNVPDMGVKSQLAELAHLAQQA